jgi:hypothetical protein
MIAAVQEIGAAFEFTDAGLEVKVVVLGIVLTGFEIGTAAFEVAAAPFFFVTRSSICNSNGCGRYS